MLHLPLCVLQNEEDLLLLTTPPPPPFHLPLELLVCILECIDLTDRLVNCARVSTAWHSAAVAATRHIRHRSNSKSTTARLQAWLAVHATHLTAMQLSATYHTTALELLPQHWACRNLRELDLSHITLISSSLSSMSKHSFGGSIFIKQLTSLSLQYCCLDSLESLAAISGLHRLRLEKPQPATYTRAAASYTLDAAALAALQQLTSLQVIKGNYKKLLISISHLTAVRELQLLRCKDTAVAAVSYGRLWHQLQHVTALKIEAVPGLALHSGSNSSSSSDGEGNDSSSSWRAPLQQLLRLEVWSGAWFDPKLLAAAKRLQHLHLTSTPVAGGSQGTADLLCVLGQMKNLENLNLQGTLQHVAAASGYAALTASSKLRCLDLSRCVLPPGAARAMFPVTNSSSSSCSSSSTVKASACPDTTPCSSTSSSRGGSKPLLPEMQELLLSDTYALQTAADVAAVASACPALRNLDLTRAMPHDQQLPRGTLSCLLQLTGLTGLSASQVHDAAAEELAKLTQLEALSVVWQSSISDAGVQRLTALQRLTQLWVHGSLSPQLAPGYVLSLQSKVRRRGGGGTVGAGVLLQ